MFAGCTGKPSPDPAYGAFSCSPSTPSGGICNATCLYGTSRGDAPPFGTCTDGAWNISGGTCSSFPVVPPMFATSSFNSTWFLASSCNANLTYALETAMLADLEALLVEANNTGLLSVAQSSCTTESVRASVCWVSIHTLCTFPIRWQLLHILLQQMHWPGYVLCQTSSSIAVCRIRTVHARSGCFNATWCSQWVCTLCFAANHRCTP
jgi:hypothetical protein